MSCESRLENNKLAQVHHQLALNVALFILHETGRLRKVHSDLCQGRESPSQLQVCTFVRAAEKSLHFDHGLRKLSKFLVRETLTSSSCFMTEPSAKAHEVQETDFCLVFYTCSSTSIVSHLNRTRNMLSGLVKGTCTHKHKYSMGDYFCQVGAVSIAPGSTSRCVLLAALEKLEQCLSLFQGCNSIVNRQK